MNFQTFKQAIAQQFKRMQAWPLFETKVTKDELWATYIGSFPAGSNPIYRERTEHDCNCCRSFIRTIGNIAAIDPANGKLVTIWDVAMKGEPEYNAVAAAMSKLVSSSTIENVYRHVEAKVGTEKSLESLLDGTVKTWDHFHVHLPRELVLPGDEIGPVMSQKRSDFDVLSRGLREITVDALETVADMIATNTLYRGDDSAKHSVSTFRSLKADYDAVADSKKDNFVWVHVGKGTLGGSIFRLRNSSLGTLLVAISEGEDLEVAVKQYESKVAPANYKRTTAVVTPAMVAKAKEEVQKLGLTSALQRRYARLDDIHVGDILFANRDARQAIAGHEDAFAEVAAASDKVNGKTLDRVEQISIDDFIANVLPRSKSIEVLFENKHQSNLVSLVAPQDATAGKLFNWDNGFSWSYAGEVTDAIKEKVKAAGGNVEGDLCCRLAWSNYDDLDLHLETPRGEIAFFRRSDGGGMLDVDMNAGGGRSREPVENIFFKSAADMPEGEYHLFVHQYNMRETSNVGFEAQVDFKGQVWTMSHPQAVRQGANVTVAKFRYSRRDGFKMLTDLQGSKISKEVYGLPTEQWHQVNVLMHSPNYWGDGHGVGHKHYFFMLNGCKNDGTARGFYNEFLKPELSPHRKVLEMVGASLRLAPADDQLSGLGFSATVRNELVVRVKGTMTRTMKVMF